MKPDMSFAAVARHCEQQTHKSWRADLLSAMEKSMDPYDTNEVAKRMGVDYKHETDMAVFAERHNQLVQEIENDYGRSFIISGGKIIRKPPFLGLH